MMEIDPAHPSSADMTTARRDQPPIIASPLSTFITNSESITASGHDGNSSRIADAASLTNTSAPATGPSNPTHSPDNRSSPGSPDPFRLWQHEAIFKECTDIARDDKWNIRRFEQLSFISLYNLHLEIMTLEAQIFAAQGTMSQNTQERLRTLLRDYSEAMRNIEYLTKFPSQRFDNAFNRSNIVFPFVKPKMSDNYDYCNFHAPSPAVDQVRSLLQQILPQRVILSDASLFYKLYKRRPEELPRPSPRQLSPVVDGFARILVATTGGVFLLVPMIIMTWVTNVHIRLIIVSVSVLWFAISIALTSKATNQELITATAAYTAVLVVYVGTTSSSRGG
jgi:hypothetical protein